MTYFIAEISSNHNNSLKRIEKLILAAKRAGYDAVKFQIFKIDKLFHPIVLKKSKIHRDRKKWELDLKYIEDIKKICKNNKIDLGFTPFYLEAVEILNKYTDFFKIASYEILWHNLIKECAKTNKKMIISTGMANINEVTKAFDVAVKFNQRKNVSLLHCVSSYPANFKNCNLSSIGFLRSKFNCKVGWSDHTVDPDVLNRAINHWNAEEIEMHFDLDGKGFEANVGHCWFPKDSKILIDSIKKNQILDGIKQKKPSVAEKDERNWRADHSDGLRPLKKIRHSL